MLSTCQNSLALARTKSLDVKFQITMTKIPNYKPVLVIEYWNLRFVCDLVLGI